APAARPRRARGVAAAAARHVRRHSRSPARSPARRPRTRAARAHPARPHAARTPATGVDGAPSGLRARARRRHRSILRTAPVHLRSRDLLQHKPGRFTLARCRACRHIFQNPRLSLAGLDFYYKDFYDGIGEAGMEFIFGYGVAPYLARARMMKAARELAPPKR